MNLTPLLGLLGAVSGSISVFKWILVAFAALLLAWMLSSAWGTRNALEARALKDLIKSAAQWHTRSAQDSHALIGLMNANYAMAYLNVARGLGSDADIERHAKVKVDDVVRDIEDMQSRAIQKLVAECPSTGKGLGTGLGKHTGWVKKP